MRCIRGGLLSEAARPGSAEAREVAIFRVVFIIWVARIIEP